MNYRSVVNVIGFILIFLGMSMIFSIGWALYYDDGGLVALFKSMTITTISGAQAAVRGIRNIKTESIQYRSLQEVFT